MISNFQKVAPSVSYVALLRLVSIRIVCTVDFRSVQRCNEMQKNSIVKFGLLARLFQNLRLLLPLIRDYWKGTYRDVSVKSIVIFILTFAYIISPIDLIPDWILGFGQIDDIGILGLALYFLEKDLVKYKEWKDGGGSV